ncbi:MAG TPA: antitoxin Xre/MbcA/ParS toxin-binding domain-containing protein [Chthoniobacterales bacterium]|jgi:DNA-binding transcriptional regulator YiaG
MKMSKDSTASSNGAGRPSKKSAAVITAHSATSRRLESVNQAATDVRRLARTYKLSNEVVSRVTGASPRTVSYWNAGTPPQRSSAQKIKEATRLFDALADIIKGSAVGKWLQQPNKQFDGSSPLQVIERGEADRIWRMIWQLREGNSG